MTHTITHIPGDGIGQEVVPAAYDVLATLQLPLSLQIAEAGFHTFERYGTALPDHTIDLCQTSDAILFGATQSPMTTVAGYQSPILTLRHHFHLYANLRPAYTGDVDLLIVRENTEGLYSRRERTEQGGRTAITERVITAEACERIVTLACEQSRTRRGHLTIVHKANVLKATCGLFRRIAIETAHKYPDVRVDEMLIDTMAMRLAMNPEQFDVIVTTNLFGDILSDLAAGVTGGLGLAPSANIGVGVPVFEPVHGSAPDIAGTDTADPRAAILSAALLLDTLGYHDAAKQVKAVTYRTAHSGSTTQTTHAIINQLRETLSI